MPHRTSLRASVPSCLRAFAFFLLAATSALADDAAVDKLRDEVAGKGWILFSAKTDNGDYDLFLSRPDGSAKRAVTQTPEWSEYGGRFSPDSKRILYRRLKKGAEINHDLWGARGELVLADADGSNPVVFGGMGEYPWASWSPDGKQLACLYRREGIQIIDIASKKVVKQLNRRGIFQQLYWSPDGKRLVGTANVGGQDWNIVVVDIETGLATQISRGQNCTPDWFQGDSGRSIYSHRTPGIGGDYGSTMLMQATADGKIRTLIYGERGRHIYYGCTSPDDKYAIFSFPETDGGTDSPMAIVRLADTPIIVPEDYKELKALYPNANSGPVFRLTQPGFEPHWTYVDVGGK
ncbi:MAG: TolB family protein [Tepidisphaerales bacterium]